MKTKTFTLNDQKIELVASGFDIMYFDDGSKDVFFDVQFSEDLKIGMLYQKCDDGISRTFYYSGNDCVDELRTELEDVAGDVEDEIFDKIMEVLETWAKEYTEESGIDADPMDDYEFMFTAGNVSVGGISVKVYRKDEYSYFVRVEDEKGEIVRGTKIAEISIDDYDNLPNDPYDNLVRRSAAYELCVNDEL